MARGIALLSILLSTVAARVDAAVVISWDFTGELGSQTTDASVFSAPRLSNGLLSRGPGVNATGLSDAFSSNNWTTSGTLAQAITNGDYFQIQFSVEDGVSLALSSIDATFRRSGTGPNLFQWAYSFDGFTTTPTFLSSFPYTSTASNGTVLAQLLDGESALQDITGGSTVTFRLFGAGATSSAGTFAFVATGGGGSNDLLIQGVVTPEPSGVAIYGMLFGVTAIGSVWSRRRGKARSPPISEVSCG